VIRGDRQADQSEVARDVLLQDMLALAGDADAAGPERTEFPMQRRAGGESRLVIRLQALLQRRRVEFQRRVALGKIRLDELRGDVVAEAGRRRTAETGCGRR